MSFNSTLVELSNKPDANQIDLLDGYTSYSFEYESFTQQQLLGRSQNEVWKFTHTTTGKEFAVKVVPLRKYRNNLENNDHLMKIKHEIEILETLRNHNNIIQFYGYGVDKNKESALLFMELMDYSLEDLLARQRTSIYSWIGHGTYRYYAYLITTSCLSALEFCFEMGIRNDDIKPANILLNKKGEIKISDFGEASRFGRSQNVGSLLYRPPLCHNLESKLKESENDFWGLGITLLEMLYGQNPILIINPYKSAKNELIGLIDFLNDLNPEILIRYLNVFDDISFTIADYFVVDFFREFIGVCLSNQTSEQIIKDLSNIVINYREYENLRRYHPLKRNVIKEIEEDEHNEDEFDPMINKIEFSDDSTIYSFDLSDFEFSKNVNLYGNFCAKHINTKKTLFLKYYSFYQDFTTERYFYHNISSHPNIVEYYGYGKSIMGYYMVLELHNINLRVLGRIFNAWKINFPEQFLMNIIVSIIKALEYIHSKGFYKIELKPTHILFLRSGVIKLSNFEDSLKSFQIENGSNLWNYSPILEHEKIVSNKRDKQYHNDILKFGIAMLEVVHIYLYEGRKQISNEFIEETRESLKAIYSENLVNFISIFLEKGEEKTPECQSLMETSFYEECLNKFERNQNILARFLNEVLIASEEKLGKQILTDYNTENESEIESFLKQINSRIISQDTWNQLDHSYI